MAQLRSIRALLLALALIVPMAHGFECKNIKTENKAQKVSEESTLCFLRDDTYFVSEACATLRCPFIDRLKKATPESMETERPGATLCKRIGGVVEEVTLPKLKHPVQRCLFTGEKHSASLNLLESWNGKSFSGPSRPMDL